MTEIVFEPFDLRTAGDADYEALWRLDGAMRAERLPDDPPNPLETFVSSGRNVPPMYVVRGMVARDTSDGAIVGSAFLDYEPEGDNLHLSHLDLDVLASHRRRGIGRRLLRFAAETARDVGHRTILMFTTGLVPAGAAFAQAIGAEPGLVERHSQLALAELDRALLREWQTRAAQRAADYELLFIEHPIPAELQAPMAELMNVMNTAPRGELDVEDHTMSAEKLRAHDASLVAAGREAWTVAARRRSTGELAGYTMLVLNPREPTIVRQGATGVQPAHRNLGLGRWIKAAMLERLLCERPEARFVRTDNAEQNAPMLAINVALGFRHYMDVTIWQAAVSRALAFAEQ